MTLDDALSDLSTIKTVAEGLSRRRDDIFVLLAVIYRVGCKWLDHGPPTLKKDLIVHLDRPFDRRTTKSVFRFVLEATLEKTNPKAKSRYANALRYARMKGCVPQKLITFIKRNDSIEKCANRFLAERKTR